MKKNNLFLLSSFFVSVICSCTENLIEQERNNVFPVISSEEILSFDSKERFQQAITNFDPKEVIKTRSGKTFYSAADLYDEQENNKDVEDIGFLVPDEKYRNFLSKNLEIIVNDTLYRITKDGTFYAKVENKDELETAINKVELFKNIDENLKELGNVKLKN